MFCLRPFRLHTPSMRGHLMLPLGLSGILMLSNCSKTGSSVGGATASYNPVGTGPFDINGNYIEAWADNPAKWPTRPSRPAPSAPALTPPPAVDPIPTPSPSPMADMPMLVSNHTAPAPPPPAAAPAPARAASPAQARPATVSAPKPKPKPQAPSPIRHTVKRGDTLYALSKRYNSPVAAIQKANGLRGSLIQIGQKLVIPRY